jgi:hypothetical protein
VLQKTHKLIHDLAKPKGADSNVNSGMSCYAFVSVLYISCFLRRDLQPVW